MDKKDLLPGTSRRSFLKSSGLVAISASFGVSALGAMLGDVDYKDALLGEKIDLAYRYTDYKSLLNLEFYFINVQQDKETGLLRNKLKFSYSQEESYMIVKLPQQHLSEQYIDLNIEETKGENYTTIEDKYKASKLDQFKAAFQISGYSYLVFRIVFRKTRQIKENKGRKGIKASIENFMDWNAEHFQLTVRQNLSQSIFQIKTNSNYSTENKLPFIVEGKAPELANYPKAYGDPITLIEAPYGLFLSPKLPDQDQFEFFWTFNKDKKGKDWIGTKDEAELWMASLQIKKKEDKKEYFPHLADEKTPEMEVMVLGANEKDPFETGILPTGENKKDITTLYIAYKLLARTDKMTFTPLGISTRIELNNKLINKTAVADGDLQVTIYKWIQDMAFGRDQYVEVTDVVQENQFGFKMLYVQTTKRKTKLGVAYLDKRTFLMPLEIEKDYTTILKGGMNLKKLKFLEIQPKRIMDVSTQNKPTYVKGKNIYIKGGKAIGFNPLDVTGKKYIEFEMEGVDLKGKKVKKKLKPKIIFLKPHTL